MTSNPKVSLSLDQVSCPEAMAALSQAAGIRVELPNEEKLAKAPELRSALGHLGETTSFDWTRCTFAQALRELCQWYGLEPTQWVDGHYGLVPSGAPRLGPASVIADYQAAGIRVFPIAIILSRTWHLSFIHSLEGSAPGGRHGDRNNLWVRIACEIADGVPGRLAGVSNWLAEDDLGHTFESLTSVEAFTAFDLNADIGPYPDQWNTTTLFPPPSRGATQLRRLEGDLLCFDAYRCERLEFPLPLPAGGPVRERLGDVVVEVSSFEPGPEGGRTDTPADKMEKWDGPILKARIYKPRDVYVATPGEVGRIRPVLLGRSGQPYEYDVMTSGGFGKAVDEVVTVQARYAASEDPPASVVFELAIKGSPQRLFTFSLQNVPLPGEAQANG